MRARVIDRLAKALERRLPEQRLFLKSDTGMRFVRLRPATQAAIITGGALFVGWTAIVSSIFFIEAISSGSSREQAARDLMAYQVRLNALSDERDAQIAEVHAAQERFLVAMDEVSDMQSRLLASEERRRELETAVDVIQGTLRETMDERDAARAEAERLLVELETETGDVRLAADRQRDIELTLDMLARTLETTAEERDEARASEDEAYAYVDQLQFEAQLTAERGDRVFQQIEAAVAMSIEPLDDMFSATGLPTDQIIETLRRGYSGQGGPLMPIATSTRGEAPDPFSLRASEVMEELDRLTLYRMAAEQLPFAMPIRGNYRFTSGFGNRRDPFNGATRFHAGADFAGARGTPIHASADGTVIFAGRQSGYGNVVKIRHAFGFETVYAHLARIRVSEGERVSRGDRIGDMGNTGRSTGTHLHYEVRQNGDAIDPMTFITAGRDVF